MLDFLSDYVTFFNMKFSDLATVLSVGCLAGCGTLPSAGPTTSQIFDQAARGGTRRFDIVEMTSPVVAALQSYQPSPPVAPFVRDGKPASPVIGVGDTLGVALWQQTSQGLLGTAPSASGTDTSGSDSGSTRLTTLPEQSVDADGSISVPLAGRINAAGLTPFQVQTAIQQRLANQLIQPQVIVTVLHDISNAVTVNGEDIIGARVPLSPRGDRLLDVIAAAGGSKSPLADTVIALTRDGRTVLIHMADVVMHPANNIYAWPGDMLTIFRAPQNFLAFGATLNNSEVPFGAMQLNLAEAIAKTGGLTDIRADPSGVFLFRFEPAPVAQALAAPAIPGAPQGMTPILYHLDLRQSSSYFLAEQVAVQNGDIIYVANAPLTQAQKFFDFISTVTQPIIAGAFVKQSGL